MEPTLSTNYQHISISTEKEIKWIWCLSPDPIYNWKIHHTPQAACRKAYSIVDSQLSLTLNKITSVSTCTCITDYI